MKHIIQQCNNLISIFFRNYASLYFISSEVMLHFVVHFALLKPFILIFLYYCSFCFYWHYLLTSHVFSRSKASISEEEQCKTWVFSYLFGVQNALGIRIYSLKALGSRPCTGRKTLTVKLGCIPVPYT